LTDNLFLFGYTGNTPPAETEKKPYAQRDVLGIDAQNLEDVLLWRCFGGQKTGFYIDIGASEPTRHSVTYALYLAGWDGIAVEPLEDRWRELEVLRPRDINLNIAVADTAGQRKLYRSLGRGGTSTIIATAGAEMMAEHARIHSYEVAVETLAQVCSTHAQGRTEYDFLKIDVEGAEELVFKGADLEACRPQVIIAETSQKAPDWEARLCADHNYVFVTYDGVNRWYVSASQSKMVSRLKIPVNVHDRYLCVDQLGSPFANTNHPDHRWAQRFALAMIGAVHAFDDNVIVAAYLERLPSSVRSSHATPEDFQTASKAVLGRPASAAEQDVFTNGEPVLTVAAMYAQMVRSEEFNHHRGRVIAST
jgi:FkbM family methyltransferase